MKTRHYNGQLSAFVNQELNKEDRQTVAEHLMQCDACRREHDRIRLGAGLAATLERADAPEHSWKFIENELVGSKTPTLETFAETSRFGFRQVAAFASAILVVGLLTFFVYRGLFTQNVTTVAEGPKAADQPVPGVPVTVTQTDVNVGGPTNSNNAAASGPANSITTQTVASDGSYWQVETLAGKPSIGSGGTAAKLAVGEYLETDASSRVRIEVADIGKVDVGPNSRVKLVGTNDKQHRLSLERGALHAKISAPPRLFIVDTPSAMAVDLGCEYTLDVDNAGNTKLNVLSGFVALELGGRESIVPAGSSCLTVKGKGLGTPFSSVVSPEFERELYRFDFAGGGSKAVREMIEHAENNDSVTLWHLLSRVSRKDRPAVYDTLARYVPPPDGVTREAALSLDKTALERWRTAVENARFD